jgi:hypothetical protein
MSCRKTTSWFIVARRRATITSHADRRSALELALAGLEAAAVTEVVIVAAATRAHRRADTEGRPLQRIVAGVMAP